jgi:hypothetical protein
MFLFLVPLDLNQYIDMIFLKIFHDYLKIE